MQLVVVMAVRKSVSAATTTFTAISIIRFSKCGGAKGSNHLTGCAVDIKCLGPEQMIRYACLLLDIDNEKLYSRRSSSAGLLPQGRKNRPYWVNFDELILEKRGTTYWIHFAVRPKDNRRKILFDCR